MDQTAREAIVKAGEIVEGRYRIIKTLAEGGMGTVLLAEHVLIKRKVAIKILHAELATDPEVIERFMNEASAAGTLGHPNIVESTDMGFTRNDVPFIVYEYLEGSLLTDAIYQAGGMTVRRALRIATQIASALDAAHNAGIVHRDLKSDNVFLINREDAADHVKVLDFGVSRFLDTNGDDSGYRRLIVGTPEFMAPEQITTPERVDRRADIYALGVLLYEMLTARRPFKSTGDTDALLHRIVHDTPPPMSRSECPPGLQEMIFSQLLAKDPAVRYQTMREVQGAIAAFTGILRPSISIPPFPMAEVQAAPHVNPADLLPPPTPTPAPMLPPSRTPTPAPMMPMTMSERAASEAEMARGPITPAVNKARYRSHVAWLLLALVIAGAGTATLLVDPGQTGASNQAAIAALDGDAEKIAAALEATASAAKLRVESISTLPMLRAAIETDAATLKDMLRDSDFVFAPKKDEVLELFQIRDGTPISMLRIPDTARGLKPVAGSQTRFVADAKGITLVTSVPVTRQNSTIGGTVAISMPVDLAGAKRSLTDHVLRANLVGFDAPLTLVGGDKNATGTDVRVPIKIGRDFNADLALMVLIAPPATQVEADKFRLLRLVAWGVGGLLLGIYLVLLLRGRG